MRYFSARSSFKVERCAERTPRASFQPPRSELDLLVKISIGAAVKPAVDEVDV